MPSTLMIYICSWCTFQRCYTQKVKKGRGQKEFWKRVRVVAIGNRVFITSFKLAGVQGIKADAPEEALSEINRIGGDGSDVGLILLSDDIGKKIRYNLTDIRAKRPIPLIFELPSPGSSKENVDYRALLKQILGV
ncbi:MAG: V-type ATP synthase subunit F [Nitrososphaeraceae archaeon]